MAAEESVLLVLLVPVELVAVGQAATRIRQQPPGPLTLEVEAAVEDQLLVAVVMAVQES